MSSSAITSLNPNADVIGAKHALQMNITAAIGLQNVVKSNFGPKGTMKMLVSGGGQIKLTKDGKVLLDEMQIQHPTAAVIARTATAQDDITGDGTTANVLFTGELLKQAQRFLGEGVHPRPIVEGIEKAREKTLEFLKTYAKEVKDVDRTLMTQVARCSLRTKVPEELADHLTDIVVDAVNTIYLPEKISEGIDQALDLHMIEIMTMKHKTAMDTAFIRGIVLDHGARHPDMDKKSENCRIFICNISLEYEKTMVNSGFFYKTTDERSRFAQAERKVTDDRVNKIIQFKEKVLAGQKEKCGFVVINQKGIDPGSLDLLQKAGIVAIRRAKRRNMERLSRACGGYPVNSVDELREDCLGFAKSVYEHVLGEDKFTFIEGCQNPTSCTILVKGPNDHTVKQIQDAIRDGNRAIKNLLEDSALVPGGGAFELAAHLMLHKEAKTLDGKVRVGMMAFADALLVVPKTLSENSAFDTQQTIQDLLSEAAKGARVGLDLDTGKPMLPEKIGVWDNIRVKRQLLQLGSMISIKLLLVDEVIRAGRKVDKEDS